MLIRYRLADADREKYEIPEWVEFDVKDPLLSEIRAIKQAGFKGWADLERNLFGDDVDDQLAASAVVIWLAVRRHRPVGWDEFDFSLLKVATEVVSDPNP